MHDAGEVIRRSIEESIQAKRQMADHCLDTLATIACQLGDVLQRQGTIYLCGNGGSAADCQHVAAELVGRFLRERRPLPGVALTANTSILTAIGNDYHFDQVFERQVRAQTTARDAVVGISTSGTSRNVLLALRAARTVGALTVGFTGEKGRGMTAECDLCLVVPSPQTPRVQEAHILAWHIICDLIEQRVVAARSWPVAS